jgi:hypothetical protein
MEKTVQLVSYLIIMSIVDHLIWKDVGHRVIISRQIPLTSLTKS